MDLNKMISGLTSSGIGSGLAGGVAGGALVSALGSKSGRKTAKTLLKVGGLAAVGGLAWKAYQSYQQSSATTTAPAPQSPAPEPHQSNWRGLEQPAFEAITQQQNESTGILLLRSMISAAMADGQLSQGEQGQIFGKLETLGLTSEERGTLFDELANPWAPADFGAVKDPVVAIEIYTAAFMTVDEECEAGRAHLADLAASLRLPPALVTSLHARIQEQEQAA